MIGRRAAGKQPMPLLREHLATAGEREPMRAAEEHTELDCRNRKPRRAGAAAQLLQRPGTIRGSSHHARTPHRRRDLRWGPASEPHRPAEEEAELANEKCNEGTTGHAPYSSLLPSGRCDGSRMFTREIIGQGAYF